MITDADVRALLDRLDAMRPERPEDVRTVARVRGLCTRAMAGDEHARRVVRRVVRRVGWLMEGMKAG